MEKLFIFHMEDAELKKLKQIAGVLKIRTQTIDTADYLQTLGDLVSGKKNPLVSPYEGEIPEESLLLLCDFEDGRMDKLLLALRRKQVRVDYKAILTPTNRSWNALRLMLEMKAEKAAYEKPAR